MNSDPLPILYSFRRCPYAIRARMALFNAHIKVDLHEVSLKNKPQAMLEASSKGTVPVLCVEGKVLEESLDIMLWALGINDPNAWYSRYSEAEKCIALQLIEENDSDFKQWLDKYKYADRYPEQTPDYYRQQAERFLVTLEGLLRNTSYLIGSTVSLVDVAIFPFVRQFAMVNKAWFAASPYPNVRIWLMSLLSLPLFARVMAKAD